MRSITFRLTLLFASVSTTVLLLLGLLIGSLVEHHFEELDMELLEGKLELLGQALAKVSSGAQLDALPKQWDESLVGHRGLAVLVLRPGGSVLYATPGAVVPPALLALASSGSGGARPLQWTGPERRSYRGIAARAQTGIAGAGSALVALATDMSHHQYFMQSFKNALWMGVGLAAVLTGLLGWLAARRGLRPLRDISLSAAGITANRLDHRLVAASMPSELAEVARTLNDMLSRLEDSFCRLSDFSSDLAHELRTPVSNLLTQTQVTLAKTRTLDIYQDVLASNAEEFERLSRMIADMLFLAKSDNALIVPHLEEVDLAAEVGSLLEFYGVLAEEKGLTLSGAGAGVVRGDRLMLRRAISNLLSNALRHAPQGGSVAVQVGHADASQVLLTVSNTGETIAPEHLPRLFDRFFRVDASRKRFSEGAGLGLAITRSIARGHGGEVSVASQDGVTTFGMRLPV